MARSAGFEVKLAPAARRDTVAIGRWTLKEFGEAAVLRYEALIQQALSDIGADPERPGSQQRPDIMIREARIYHLAFSRDRVRGGSASKVKAPRHFLLYRLRKDGTVEVARILHDLRELSRHLPRAYRGLNQ